MADVNILPIPDWGLNCPECNAPLAGMSSHVCERCGARFDMCHLIATRRPILPVGLTCPKCGYLLNGLDRNRCPECGKSFYVRQMLEGTTFVQLHLGIGSDPPDAHLPRRDPQFNGRERPVPEFGLNCPECEQPLVGVADEFCPECGAFLDLPSIPRGGDWVDISRYVLARVAPIARRVLYEARVPYMIGAAERRALSGFMSNMELVATLLVPRVFFLDAMYELTRAAPPEEEHVPRWTCPKCGEDVPAGFEICWNCNADYPGTGATSP